MSDKNSPKHSVGKGAQREHHNEDAANERHDDQKDGYLEKKWKKIANDFNKTYGLHVSTEELKDNSFSKNLKKLEEKTGKSKTDLENEIREWKE